MTPDVHVAVAVPPTSTDIVETKTSRARKLVRMPTVSCQSKPSGANTGCARRPSGRRSCPLRRLALERVGFASIQRGALGVAAGRVGAPAPAAPRPVPAAATRGYALSHHMTMQMAMMTVPAVCRNARP